MLINVKYLKKPNLERIKSYISKHRKVLLWTLLAVLLLLVLLLINRIIFSAKLSSLESTSEEIASIIESTNTQFLDSNQQEEIEDSIDELSVGYPESLAKLSYPFSNDKRTNINQIYKLTETSTQYVYTLYELPQINTIINSVPKKEALTTNPELFISNYDKSIDELRKYENAIDIDTVLKIFISIRDSAEFYVSNNRFDIFEARYDNVYSELEKEYKKSTDGFKDNVIAELNSLQNSIEKLE